MHNRPTNLAECAIWVLEFLKCTSNSINLPISSHEVRINIAQVKLSTWHDYSTVTGPDMRGPPLSFLPSLSLSLHRFVSVTIAMAQLLS